jgi:translocation and assembly module TamA
MRRAVAFACWLAGCATEKANGRPWVRDLRLEGIHRVDEKDLRSRIALEGRSWVPFSRKPYLDPFTVDIDRKRIEAYYASHGFFGAQVTRADVKPRDRESVDVHISVDEGEPTHISAVRLEGLESVDERTQHEVKKRTLQVGDVFNHERYLAEKDRIAGVLKARAYAWAEVDGTVEVNRDTHLAVVTLRVRPGERARFGELVVIGTQKVKPHQVESHTALRKGAPFSLEALEDVRGRVYNLGMFSSVKVDYEHDVQHPEIANVLVTVREGTFHEVRLGLGFGFESQRTDVHGSVEYEKRNFLGGLRTLRLRLVPAYVALPAFWDPQRQGLAGTVEAQLQQPNLFWRTTLRFIVGFDLGIDYAYQYYGPRTTLALGRDFWRARVHAAISYNFQYDIFFDTDPTILEQPHLAGPLFGFVSPYRLGWWQEDVALDLRDRPLDTRKGGYFALTAELGGDYAIGAFDYQKLTPDVRGYLPLGSRVVVAARAQFGQIFTQGTLGSPITRRFYLGGPSSHRGFNYERLSPQVPSGEQGVQPIPIGGDQMFLGQLELRISLFRLAGNWLSLASFLDAGDVAAPSCATAECRTFVAGARQSIDFADLHYATGGGLRYKTLIGTLRVDVGVRLNRLSAREADGTPNPDPGEWGAFHISVGEAF